MKKLLLLFIIPFLCFGQDSTLNGDVDCNGEITSEDASLILQFVTNVIEELPCGDNMIGLTPDQLEEMINMMNDQVNNNSEQPISMIGPMYVYEDFSDFVNVYNAETNYLYYFDAVRFCGQLSYNGYDDWFLASLTQLEEYISTSPGTIEMTNVNDESISTYTFWLKREPSFSTGYNSNNYVFQYFELSGPNHDNPYLMISSGGTSASYALSCFCVR